MSLESLLGRLDANLPKIKQRDLHYSGDSRIVFHVDRLDDRMLFHSNLARVAVQAVAERIRLDGVKAEYKGRDISEKAWRLLEDSDFQMLIGAAIQESLALGASYLMVGQDWLGRPTLTAEPAELVAVERDPVTRAVTEAVKRWVHVDANGVVASEHIMHYTPLASAYYRREGQGELKHVATYDNPLLMVPVVPLTNVMRLRDDQGGSVIDDLAPLLDALNKLILDMLTTSEAVARPKRWATGVALEDEGEFIEDEFEADSAPVADGAVKSDGVDSPFKDSDGMWISEAPDSKFGQLPGADLGSYSDAVDIITRQISAITSLPPHMLGVSTGNPSTAEALRVSESSLARVAQGRIRVFNAPIEWAVRLLLAADLGVDPNHVKVGLIWADTQTPTLAQSADAAVKLMQQDIVDRDEARRIAGVLMK